MLILDIIYFWLGGWHIPFLQEEIPNPSPNFLMNQTNLSASNEFSMPARTVADELPRPPIINRREIKSTLLFFFFIFIWLKNNSDFSPSKLRFLFMFTHDLVFASIMKPSFRWKQHSRSKIHCCFWKENKPCRCFYGQYWQNQFLW